MFYAKEGEMKDPTKKRCPPGKRGCGKWFLLTPEFWPKDKTKSTGFGTYCLSCSRKKSLLYARKRRKENPTIITTSTHFRCEKMQAVLSKFECLRRQKAKGRVRRTSRFGNVSVFDKFEECLNCPQGKGIKKEIRALL